MKFFTVAASFSLPSFYHLASNHASVSIRHCNIFHLLSLSIKCYLNFPNISDKPVSNLYRSNNFSSFSKLLKMYGKETSRQVLSSFAYIVLNFADDSAFLCSLLLTIDMEHCMKTLIPWCGDGPIVL